MMGAGENSRYRFFDTGFHGDRYLLALVHVLIQRSTLFIESGANVGSTLAYVARTYPHIICLSCEPDDKAFALAASHTEKMANVSIYHETSQEFFGRLSSKPEQFFANSALFWLDAHGYGFDWPLLDELSFITEKFKRGTILIDDFKVPGQDQFAYHRFNNQVCSFDYVRDALNPDGPYRLYYPDYGERTSLHHRLTGWGLIIFGDAPGFEPSELIEFAIKNG